MNEDNINIFPYDILSHQLVEGTMKYRVLFNDGHKEVLKESQLIDRYSNLLKEYWSAYNSNMRNSQLYVPSSPTTRSSSPSSTTTSTSTTNTGEPPTQVSQLRRSSRTRKQTKLPNFKNWNNKKDIVSSDEEE
jgi:hypothetical protein